TPTPSNMTRCFFFSSRRRHTRSYGDWSSDVCSSDLTLEETYEVLEAIDNRDWQELTGELGDLLLQVLFYAEMAKEQGSFSIDDVLDRLSTKLVDRHPHVFGDVKAETSSDVLRNWEALKAEEKKKRLEAGGGKAPKL